MKISPEAREAALRLAGFDSEDDLIYWGRSSHHQKVDGVAAAMQSLINSTLEKAAGVADEFKQLGYMSDRERDYCQQHGEEIATAIRQLMESE